MNKQTVCEYLLFQPTNNNKGKQAIGRNYLLIFWSIVLLKWMYLNDNGIKTTPDIKRFVSSVNKFLGVGF